MKPQVSVSAVNQWSLFSWPLFTVRGTATLLLLLASLIAFDKTMTLLVWLVAIYVFLDGVYSFVALASAHRYRECDRYRGGYCGHSSGTGRPHLVAHAVDHFCLNGIGRRCGGHLGDSRCAKQRSGADIIGSGVCLSLGCRREIPMIVWRFCQRVDKNPELHMVSGKVIG